MSLPPSLTWLQLLARDAGFVCEDGPQWFRDLLAKNNGHEGKARTLVTWNKSWENLTNVPGQENIVAINSPRITTDQLKAAGFKSARRFAVVPSLANARWYLCLDSGPVASSSFNIYTPARRTAHIKKALVKLAARLGVPYWYRDQIVIASRELPPLEQKLSELFPGQSIHVGLSSGAPEPAINRKASAVVLGDDGSVLAFVKMAGSEISRRIMKHEADVLPALADRAGVAVAVPKLLFAGELNGQYVTVQTPLAGRAAPARFTSAHEHFLAALRCGATKPAAATEMVASLPRRISGLNVLHADLTEALERALPTLEEATVASTIVHGDFAPWNLRLHRGQISSFDWEYAQLDGLPLVDQIHFQMQLGFQLHKWTPARAKQSISQLAARRPVGLEPAQVSAIAMVYLLDNLVRLLDEGYDPNEEMLAWYRQLLASLVNDFPRREGVAA